MPIRTPLCDLFGIEHPVLLAPMACVSGGVLAAAVSWAGGLGQIGGGYGEAFWHERELVHTRVRAWLNMLEQETICFARNHILTKGD